MTIAWQDLALGTDDSNIILDRVDDLGHMTLALFQLAQRQVVIRAPRLEWPEFRSEQLEQEISRIIRLEQTNRICFLIEDEEYFLRNNTRLLAQCRRLSSYVKLRTIPKEYREPIELFAVVDNIAFLHQARVDMPYGVANLNAPGRAQVLGRQFNEIWERSQPPAELFRLGLTC